MLNPTMATVITEAGTTLTLPESLGSLSDFRDWIHSASRPQRGRFTFVAGGCQVDMSPERISGHNDIKTRLTSVLDTLVSAEQLGTVFSDGVLFINEAADLACEPDLMYGSVETIRSARITFHAWQSSEEGNVELHGSPDMVAEIVSDSSVRKDTVELYQAYFDAGVGEYWLIDGRADEIDFQLLVRGSDSFVVSPADADGYRYSPAFGRSFRFVQEVHPILGLQVRLQERMEVT